MIVFLTSVRHPQNSNDFRKVEALLEMSLRSVCAQTDGNFRVVVVCNAVPQIGFKDERIVYHVVDFPPPSLEKKIKLRVVYKDKGTKMLSGMLLARQFNPDYFAIFDADDFVSRRVAEFANARPGQAGWYVDAGYLLNHATWRVQRKYGLVRYCGTTLIPSAAHLLRLSGAEGVIDERSSQEEINAKIPMHFTDFIMGTHEHMVHFFFEHQLRLRPLPFRGCVWVQQTGENVYGDRGTSGLPVTQKFCDEFGLTMPAGHDQRATLKDRAKELWACMLSKMGTMRSRMKGFRQEPIT